MRILLMFMLVVVSMGSGFGQNINNLLKVKEDGKWGLYDLPNSKVVVEPEYDRIGQRSRWGIKTMLDNKAGMVSNEGELISKPRFRDIFGISSEMYGVMLMDGTRNILDVKTGEIILPIGDYDAVIPINGDYFIIRKDGLLSIMDKYGKYITSEGYLGLRGHTFLKEHVLFLSDRKKEGIMRVRDGAVVVPPAYKSIVPLNDTYSKFQADSSSVGIMNHLEHRVIIEDKYVSVELLGNDYFILEDLNNGQYLFDIKNNKKFKLGYVYRDFRLIHEKYIVVRNNSFYGIINSRGNIILPINYDDINYLISDGNKDLITIQRNGLRGVYDITNGKELLPVSYKSVVLTEDNFILVNSIGGQGLYNRHFEKLLDTKYHKIQIKGNSIKARRGKGVEIFWVDGNQRITDREDYDEFYSLKIGYKRSALISDDIQKEKKEIIFPDIKFEWVASAEGNLKAYKPVDSDSVWSGYDYIPHQDYKTNTHFSMVQTGGISANRNDLIRRLSDEYYSFKPFRLFDGNKGVFLQPDYMFTGFRLKDFSRDDLAYMAVILKDGTFRMITRDGNWLLDENKQPLNASYIEEMSNGMIRYAVGGEWVAEKDSLKGIHKSFIINSEGIFRSFDIGRHYEQKYWQKKAYLKNAKWGFLDSTCQVVIPAQYENVSDFKHGKAIISGDGKIGCINQKNKLIIPIEYNDISITRHGTLILEKKNEQKINYRINKNGVQLLKDDYSFSDQLIDNARRVKKGNKYGSVDEKGNIIIPTEYDSLGHFNEGYALAVKNNNHFIVDKNGGELLKNTAFNIKGTVHHDLIRVEQNNKYGFIDINGKIMIPIQFGLAFDFQEAGLARVVVARKTGLIDHTGGFVLAPDVYELVFPFNEHGLAVVQLVQFGVKGLINTDGAAVVKPYYEEIEPFHDGYAVVRKDNKYGYINLAGEEVIPASHYKVFKASQGTMAVRERMADLWVFKDSSNQRINDLEFTEPALYKDGFSIVTIVTDTQSYHRCLVNLAGDTLFFSDRRNQVYFYRDGIVGIKHYTHFSFENVKISHHFRLLDEVGYRGKRGGYRNLSPFVDKVAIARPQINMGLMDEHSNYITTIKYKQILRNPDQSYTAVPGRFYGYADKDGHIILEPGYDHLSEIIRNDRHILHVEKGDQIGYMDISGNWIWEMDR